MAIEEIDLDYWGKEMTRDESWWWEWCPQHLLQQLQRLIGPTPIFWAFFILFFGAFGRLTISSRRHKVKKLKYYIIFIVPWGTQRELVNTPWTHHVLHLFLVEWGTLFLGDLVHFGTLWLYWSMYCMLSSSQPLIRTFISFNLSHLFWKWLGFWFSHSYLKERASHL